MKVLNDIQVRQKIKRLAYEIIEKNYAEESVILVGINTNGYRFASLLMSAIPKEHSSKFRLHRIQLNPAAPLESPILVDHDIAAYDHKNILIIDDVCNTGRTVFFAIKPFLSVIPRRIQVAVLVDRQHKSYPIDINYVGLSLATTIQENINVSLEKRGSFSVILE